MTNIIQLPIQSQGFLRLPEVLKLIPVSKATWWNGVRSGRFPKQVKLGARISVWRTSDIQTLLEKIASGKAI